VVELEIHLHAEVAVVPGRLLELARPAPDERGPAAELLAVRVPQEVVAHAGAEVVRPLDAAHDLTPEDEVDAVVGVEAERREGRGLPALVELRLQARHRWLQGSRAGV